jgi:hypothetical protein
MIGTRHKLIALAAASAFALAAGQASAALNAYVPPNYAFPDGSPGFALQTHGGGFDPVVLVEFNPVNSEVVIGSDGVLDHSFSFGTHLDPTNAHTPFLQNNVDGGALNFLIALLDVGDGSVIPGNPVSPPNSDGHTGFHGMDAGHVIDINFIFGGSDVMSWSWGAFNPQPDPPGDFISGEIGFAADPFMGFQLDIDGTPRTFTLAGAPEPGTWALMIAGLAGAGLMLRRARQLRLEPV